MFKVYRSRFTTKREYPLLLNTFLVYHTLSLGRSKCYDTYCYFYKYYHPEVQFGFSTASEDRFAIAVYYGASVTMGER